MLWLSAMSVTGVTKVVGKLPSSGFIGGFFKRRLEPPTGNNLKSREKKPGDIRRPGLRRRCGLWLQTFPLEELSRGEYFNVSGGFVLEFVIVRHEREVVSYGRVEVGRVVHREALL